ncbi:unnamed protein product [Jaminaea pallidilutea]
MIDVMHSWLMRVTALTGRHCTRSHSRLGLSVLSPFSSLVASEPFQSTLSRIPLAATAVAKRGNVTSAAVASRRRSVGTLRTMAPASKEFFSSKQFAVAGASLDERKIGNKVVKWYKSHGFDTIPIHPKESTVEDLSTVASVFDLMDAPETSLSIITPPKISLPIVKTAVLELNIPWVWLQPGAEDDDLKDWVDSLPDDDLKSRIIFGGPCILVEGEELAQAEGKL